MKKKCLNDGSETNSLLFHNNAELRFHSIAAYVCVCALVLSALRTVFFHFLHIQVKLIPAPTRKPASARAPVSEQERECTEKLQFRKSYGK